MCKRAVNRGPVGLQRPAAGRRCLGALLAAAFPLSSCRRGGSLCVAASCPPLRCTARRCSARCCNCIALRRSVLRCSACWRAAGRGRGLGDGLRSALGSPAPVPARALRRARAARFVLNQPEVLLDNAEMSWHKKKKKSGILTTRGISTAALIASGPPSAAPAAALCSALRAQAGEQHPNPTCCSENKNALYFCLF